MFYYTYRNIYVHSALLPQKSGYPRDGCNGDNIGALICGFPSFTNGWNKWANKWAERTKFTYRITHGQSNVDLVPHGLGLPGARAYDRRSALHGVHMMVHRLFSRRLRGLGKSHLWGVRGSKPFCAIARANEIARGGSTPPQFSLE